MKFWKIFSLLILSTSISLAQRDNISTIEKSASQVSPKENTIYLELFGRNFIYGVGYTRNLNSEVSLGLSFSYVAATFGAGPIETQIKAYSIPLYLNYYLNQNKKHKFLLTAGFNIFSFEATAKLNDQTQNQINSQIAEASASDSNNSGEVNQIALPDLKLSGSGTMAFPQIGTGYEYRSRNGFYASANLYATLVIEQVLPWAGFSFGVMF